MKCDYKGCSRQCCGDVNDEICNILRAYHQGRADREKEICDFLKEIANGDDVNTKLLERIKGTEQIRIKPIESFGGGYGKRYMCPICSDVLTFPYPCTCGQMIDWG